MPTRGSVWPQRECQSIGSQWLDKGGQLYVWHSRPVLGERRSWEPWCHCPSSTWSFIMPGTRQTGGFGSGLQVQEQFRFTVLHPQVFSLITGSGQAPNIGSLGSIVGETVFITGSKEEGLLWIKRSPSVSILVLHTCSVLWYLFCKWLNTSMTPEACICNW